jgi:hypothetical protein
MSREVRRVPPNWEHPKEEKYDFFRRTTEERYKPLHDGYKRALADFAEKIKTDGLEEAIDWYGGGPKKEDYMPDWPAGERTHYQMYETCSEGTPISPVFATPEALAHWLADTGASSFADRTATYEQWLRVCKGGWAVSAVMVPGKGIVSGVEGLSDTE